MGGEDRHFFQRVTQSGHTIVWCDDAIVDEWNPVERCTDEWLIRRFSRIGHSTSFVDVDLAGGRKPIAAAVAIVAGVCWLLRGVLTLPFTWMMGREKFVQSRRLIAYGWGRIAGVFGKRIEEYRDVVGQ